MGRVREIDLREIKEFFKDFGKYIVVSILVILLFIYVISFQQVLGPSMEPNYNEGEIYLLNKFKYKVTKPKRFEVVVVNTKSSKYMIKRVIGLPGEEITYKDDVLYVDGKIVAENFNRASITEDFDIESLGNNKIPLDKYFVLGDNRGNSTDSRIFGFVDIDEIVGKVEFRLWPIFKWGGEINNGIY